MAVAIFGPAIICVILSAIMQYRPRQEHWKRFWLILGVLWLITTSILSVYYWIADPSSVSLLALAVYTVIAFIPALIIALIFSPIPGIRKNLASLTQLSGHLIWYVLAILTMPAIMGLSVVITLMLGGPLLSTPTPAGNLIELVGLVIITFLFTFFFSGGINEETGWTGFVLPRLQARQSPLVATILLWGIWIIWHLPYHFLGLWSPGLDYLLHTMLGLFFLRFIFTWLYNRTNGGILTGVLLHTSANVATLFIPVTYTQIVLTALIAITVIFIDRMWKHLPAKPTNPSEDVDVKTHSK